MAQLLSIIKHKVIKRTRLKDFNSIFDWANTQLSPGFGRILLLIQLNICICLNAYFLFVV